jgi:hypothetical protein
MMVFAGRRGLLGALAGLLAPWAAGAAPAGQPSAIVEDVAAPSLTLQPMDYVAAGQVIALKADEAITLDYLASCAQERIRGGTVTVGTDQSTVAGGTVARDRVACDGGALQLSADQAAKSGVVVFRKKPGKHDALPAPALTVHSLGPVIDLGAPGRLTIERLDMAQPPLALSATRRWIDLGAQHHPLVAGGLYRCTAGGHSLVFRVDPAAAQPGGPLVGRLVRL